ncbi:surface-adhesin E family protein [Nitrosomonas communis]|uniref:Surface-adhesin protein E-like domain-containing protein n=1 Tax=Nitrosomonas communis TaxID=44574 RepID=A0A1H2WPV7_9PROT|nr:surface-adhesin E family protein [Nitrosomonas communis]SDW82557.1 hypothetical protein SAMN05421882_103039 [Nitrosomonas communis]
MRGILLASIIALATNAVMADWSLVDESADGSAIIYSDFDTVQIDGNKIKMWSLGDFRTVKETNGVKFLSSKYQKEYDCKLGQVRMLAFILFSSNMGEGQVVYSDNQPDKWAPVAAGTVGETLWRLACEKNISKD